MAKIRLSKLQRCILKEIYKYEESSDLEKNDGFSTKNSVAEKFMANYIRAKVFEIYYGAKRREDEEEFTSVSKIHFINLPLSAQVAVSRSLKTLERNGYSICNGSKIKLTPEGIVTCLNLDLDKEKAL